MYTLLKKGEKIDKIVDFFSSIGKTYKSTLEKMIRGCKELYSEDEFQQLRLQNEKIDPVLEIQAWTMEVASTDPVPQYDVVPKSYTSFVYSSLVKSSLSTPPKSSLAIKPELIECLDTIMKEIMNAYKGIREPMHVIMEEEEMYEESVMGSPSPNNLSDNEESEIDIRDNGLSIGTPAKSVSLDSSTVIDTPMSPNTMDTIGSPKPGFVDTFQIETQECDQKEGRLLFSALRGQVVKAFELKSGSKADIYLDRITFIARTMINMWFGKQTSVQNFNSLVGLLKEKAYLISFPALLESFRKMNSFELDLNGYQPFCELIQATLTEVLSSNQVSSAA